MLNEMTDRAEYTDEIIMTEYLESKRKIVDDEVIDHREFDIESPPLDARCDVATGELHFHVLSRSQAHWLSIGEKFGEWLTKQRKKL